MSMAFILIKRNIRLFFKDKGMFFTSLITPAILLVLYVTFLGNVYRDSFTSNLPNSLKLSESIIEGLVGNQLISSILAVSCVTVAFCSNFLMVQDKANGTIRDLRISPVKSATLSLSYYVATLLSTLIICFAATGICLTYVAIVGWYMSLADIFFLFLDILLLVLFGTALSSIINFFLSTQGQISAVGTIISAGYGFICGAYMPISSFGEGLQKIISFLPGTYGTSLIRNHAMQGALAEMKNQGIPPEVIEKLKDSLDCNLYFFGSQVNIGTMYMILGISFLVLAVLGSAYAYYKYVIATINVDTITRGLDYYTGTVYETFLNDYKELGSVCSGGRYENLAEYYTDKKLPGVGISIGLTRLFYKLNELQLIKSDKYSMSDILIIPMTEDMTKSIELASDLRKEGINTEVYLNDKKLKAKFKYADKLKIPYVAVIGEDEISSNTVKVKNMETGEETPIELDAKKICEVIKN